MGYKNVFERSNLIKSLENDIFELTKIIEKYRQVENVKFPEFNDDEEINAKNDELMFKMYYEHKKALENIREYSNKVKKSIEDFQAFFENTENDEDIKKSNKKKIVFEQCAFQIYCEKCKTTNFFYDDNKPPYRCDRCKSLLDAEEYLYPEKFN